MHGTKLQEHYIEYTLSLRKVLTKQQIDTNKTKSSGSRKSKFKINITIANKQLNVIWRGNQHSNGCIDEPNHTHTHIQL